MTLSIFAGLFSLLACQCERPFADLSSSLGRVDVLPLRGRLICEPTEIPADQATPLALMSQDELKNQEVHAYLRVGDQRLPLGRAFSDKEGYLNARLTLPAGVQPGAATLELDLGERTIGAARVWLLSTTHSAPVVRSDVDLTWLNTQFLGSLDKARLIAERAADKTTLPGMDKVYAALAGPDGGKHPVSFISGSPRFFKRILEARATLDGIVHHGLWLKPMDEIAVDRLRQGRPDEVSEALHEQVGYKLTVLLDARRDLPATTPEILMGDDSEADFVTYALYQQLTARQLSPEALDKRLEELGVSKTWRAHIGALVPSALDHLGAGVHPVQAIHINLTGQSSERYALQDWTLPGLTFPHDGALPLILKLREQGLVSDSDVDAVRSRLAEPGLPTP